MPLTETIAHALTLVTTPFWFTNVGVPTVMLAGSQLVRAKELGSLTTGADAILAVATFDVVAICSAQEFKAHIVTPALQDRVVIVHVLFGAIALVAWYLYLSLGEPALKKTPIRSFRAWAISLSGLAVFAMLIFCHLIAYIGPGFGGK